MLVVMRSADERVSGGLVGGGRGRGNLGVYSGELLMTAEIPY